MLQVNAPSGTTLSDSTGGAITISAKTPVAVSGSITSGSFTERITIAGTNCDVTATSADTPSSIAANLVASINGHSISGVTATAYGSLIEIASPLGTSISSTPSGGTIALPVGTPNTTGSYLGKSMVLSAAALTLSI